MMSVEEETYSLIKSLCSPISPKDVTYQTIIEKCNKHFFVPINELLGRVRFHKRNQLEGESLRVFESIKKACPVLQIWQ